MNIKKNALLVLLVIAMLLLCGCNIIKNLIAKNQSTDITEIMHAYTTVEITNAPDESSLSGEASIQITMPDLKKIYAELDKNGKANTMSIADICNSIAKYAKQEDFLLVEKTTALVTKIGNEWVLSSDEYIDTLTRQQANDLLVQMINSIDTIELEGATK